MPRVLSTVFLGNPLPSVPRSHWKTSTAYSLYPLYVWLVIPSALDVGMIICTIHYDLLFVDLVSIYAETNRCSLHHDSRAVCLKLVKQRVHYYIVQIVVFP